MGVEQGALGFGLRRCIQITTMPITSMAIMVISTTTILEMRIVCDASSAVSAWGVHLGLPVPNRAVILFYFKRAPSISKFLGNFLKNRCVSNEGV